MAEPRQGVRLSQLSLPRSGSQVLNWAMQLADALDYLHSRGVEAQVLRRMTSSCRAIGLR